MTLLVWSQELNAHMCQVCVLQFVVTQMLHKLNQTVAQLDNERIH